ncbi:MAG: flippase-like domain-containing protein [Verrucomicrobia bacterium]|nr:flippase-like domain-containing protein [Verrucomicrobiota bacterium]
MKKFALTALQATITVVLLWWIFSDDALRSGMARTFRSADTNWLLLGIAVAGIGVLSGICRWRIFLQIQQIPVSWWRTTQLYMIGLFFNLLFLGAIGGDVIKVLCLAKDNPGRRTAIVLSVVADRLSGLLALVTVASIFTLGRYGWFTQNPAAAGMLWFLLGYLVFSVLGVAFSFLVARMGVAEKMPRRVPGRAKFIELSKSYHLFASAWKPTLCAALISFVGLFAHYGTFYCSGRAFQPSPSLLDMYSIMPVVDVISSLPIAISGLGVREKLFEELLGSLSGIPGETALLISLAGFAVSVVWSVVGAGIFPFYRSETARRHESIRDLLKGTHSLDGVEKNAEPMPTQQSCSSVGTTNE